MSAPAQDRRTQAAPAPTSPRPASSSARERWSRRAPMLPALIFVIIVTQIPFAITIVISFMKWNAAYPDDISFGTLRNYITVFTNADLLRAVFVTVGLTVSVVLVSAVLGLAIALLLDRKFIGRGFVRTLMITPFLIVPVAAALLFKHAIFNPSYGLVNGLLTTVFGENAPQPDLMSTSPLLGIGIVLVWQWTPFMMLIMLAGLQSRPMDVYEAALVDGAGPGQTFRFITLPHLRRYIELAALLGTIYIVQNFDTVFTMTSGGLGTANLPYVIYQEFFVAQDYGVASAVGVIVVIASLVIATFALRTASTLLKEENS
ncbi:MAG: carbohydrate ABC transporter permease [Brevibacterium aurantiacum]|uniref:Sugar ABC transporter permease n=1 Tax=Brevibacterium aurantiacum TaxID=273384 RepID=A0A2A3YZF7_BREAU|nr:sugar ABC transporter permease [Brevibacterium aurantiacum]PCC44706.1 sugar ABC transporter permease [Brevibacterium aurantiacum]TGD40549.1 sugar ABC transporter permease [Brevibacterium aurantiacum]